MPWIVDDSRWPLVVATAAGDATKLDLTALLAEAAAFYGRNRPLAFLFDFTDVNNLTIAQAAELAEWRKEHADDEAHLLVSAAFAVRGDVVMLLKNAFAALPGSRAECEVFAVPLPAYNRIRRAFVELAAGQSLRA